jgi:hypothetical protein
VIIPLTSVKAGLLAVAAALLVRVEIAAILAFVGGAVRIIVGFIIIISATDKVLVVTGADKGASTGEKYN